MTDGVRSDEIALDGPRWITSGLPRWLQLSEVAPIVRAASGAPTPA